MNIPFRPEFTPSVASVLCRRCALRFTRTSAASKFCKPCAAKRKRERDLMYQGRAK